MEQQHFAPEYFYEKKTHTHTESFCENESGLFFARYKMWPGLDKPAQPFRCASVTSKLRKSGRHSLI